MLDQNTDRMWYVIGAVIVGAAIIFIMNGTAPELFASVTESFKGSSEDGTALIDEMSHRDVVYTRARFRYAGVPAGFGWTIGHGEGSVITRNIAVKPNTWYTVTYEKVGEAPDMMVMTQSGETTRLVHNGIYTDPNRVRQLITTNDRTRVEINPGQRIMKYHYLTGDVSYSFKTGETERYVTLTTGNIAPVDVAFDAYDFEYHDIELAELF